MPSGPLAATAANSGRGCAKVPPSGTGRGSAAHSPRGSAGAGRGRAASPGSRRAGWRCRPPPMLADGGLQQQGLDAADAASTASGWRSRRCRSGLGQVAELRRPRRRSPNSWASGPPEPWSSWAEVRPRPTWPAAVAATARSVSPWPRRSMSNSARPAVPLRHPQRGQQRRQVQPLGKRGDLDGRRGGGDIGGGAQADGAAGRVAVKGSSRARPSRTTRAGRLSLTLTPPVNDAPTLPRRSLSVIRRASSGSGRSGIPRRAAGRRAAGCRLGRPRARRARGASVGAARRGRCGGRPSVPAAPAACRSHRSGPPAVSAAEEAIRSPRRKAPPAKPGPRSASRARRRCPAPRQRRAGQRRQRAQLRHPQPRARSADRGAESAMVPSAPVAVRPKAVRRPGPAAVAAVPGQQRLGRRWRAEAQRHAGQRRPAARPSGASGPAGFR